MNKKELKEILQDTINSLEEFIDPKRLEFAAGNYPTKMKLMGVTVPNEKLVMKELKLQLKHNSARDRIEVFKTLVNSGIFECQHIGFEMIGRDKKAMKEINKEDVDDFAVDLDNWVSVDSYAYFILGYAWRQNIVSDEKVMKMLESDNFWIRRIPVVATVPLNRKSAGGNGDVGKTLMVCDKVVDDHNDMIVKALSWVMRVLIGVDRKAVIDFLEKYEDRLHKRVLREVRKKLETGKKI